jgi:hypothetical protein
MRRRLKGDFDDIKNYLPKDKPTISQREKRKNQAVVASVAFGLSVVGLGTLLRYTLLADQFKPKDGAIASAYAGPTPTPDEPNARRPAMSGVIMAEERLRDQRLGEVPQGEKEARTTASPSPTPASRSVTGEGLLTTGSENKGPGALPYGNPVQTTSVAAPPVVSKPLVPEVKVSVSLPDVRPGLRPVEFPTPGAYIPTAADYRRGASATSNSGSVTAYRPPTISAPGVAGGVAPGFGTSSAPSSGVSLPGLPSSGVGGPSGPPPGVPSNPLP